MIKTERSVFISYSWGAEKRHPLVDELLAALEAKGIAVKRDSNEINYGDSIRAYMDELAAGGAIILVLSEEYFKSPNCMYELREIYLNNRKEFRRRIFPVVLQGTKFHRAADRIPYIRHWEEETEKLNAALGTVARENIGAVSHNELRDYAAFRQIIDELLALIGDMNHLTEEEHLKTGFASLIERMFSQPAPDEGGGTDKTGQKKAPVKLGTLFNIPKLPQSYLERPEYLDDFRAALQKESIGLTGAPHVGVQGMGGLGKSVLAAALARDEGVQATFPDGIFWITLGREITEEELLVKQNNILRRLGRKEQEESLELSRYSFNNILQGKHCLFIIDDIWDGRHLNCFDLSGTDCRFLLTSRKADVLKWLGIDGKEIKLLTKDQALEMLARYSGLSKDVLPEAAAEIVKECGYLPLAIAAIGSMVRGKLEDRWQSALEKLQKAKLDKIFCNFDYKYENIFCALHVSVEALPVAIQDYYKTLAIFPEDAKITESVLKVYWSPFRFSDDDPLDVIDILVDASLINRVDKSSLRLHDLMRYYLVKVVYHDNDE